MAKKYETVFNDLLKRIKEGEFCAGEKLPSENELVECYAVSRQTVRQALKLLENEGRISKVRGSGTFVQTVLPQINAKCVAVITYDIAASVFPSVLSEIERTLFAGGYATMLFSTHGSVQKERQVLLQLRENPVNGIILHATESALKSLNSDLILQLYRMGTRFVFMDNRYPDTVLKDIPSVAMEDYQGAYQITAELITSGCASIGGIFTNLSDHVLNRFQGVRKAVADMGLAYDGKDFVLGNDVEMVQHLLHTDAGRRLVDKEAIVCGSGTYAFFLCEYIRQYGRGKVKTIISFDDVELPTLEGIHIIKLKHAEKKIGKACASKILKLIQGKPEASERFPWVTNEGKLYPR